MKAIQISQCRGEFELVEMERPVPRANEVLIKVEACGICHGDAVIKEGTFPNLSYPRIPGHEVIGIIAEIGDRVTTWKTGDRVGVGWHGGHCFQCKECRKGNFWGCEKAEITGITRDGGYAEYMTAREEVLVSIPFELNAMKGAPLVCAGRTAFGALKNCGAQAGDLVAIHGLGGLGHLALQYAVKMGFKTAVLSRGVKKKELAYSLGAHFYMDTASGDVVKELNDLGGAKAILCFAPDSRQISALAAALGQNGKLVIVTGVNEPLHISANLFLAHGRSITGFTGGEISDALEFSLLSKIAPMIESFPLEQASQAFARMMDSSVRFRAVLKIS
jgi:alcohol dehydrogenase/propanol-preferring alcohol dehydrogenase